MGYRLHTAKKYDVQYGSHESFGFTYCDDIMHVLWQFIRKYEYISYSGDIFEYADEFELLREDCIKLIDDIRHTEEPLMKDCDNNFIADELQELVDQSDPDNDFIHFAWY